MMMLICITQHLSNISSSSYEKVQQHRLRGKDSLLIKKVCSQIIFTDHSIWEYNSNTHFFHTYYTLYSLHCEIQLTSRKLSYMQCSTCLMMLSFHFLMITSKHVLKLRVKKTTSKNGTVSITDIGISGDLSLSLSAFNSL